MKRNALVVLLIITIIGLAIGLASLMLLKGVEVEGAELYVDLKKITEAETPIEAVLYVNNRYPVSVKIEGGSLKMLVDGLNLVDLKVPPQELKQGINNLTICALLNNMLLDEFWYQHLSKGERSNIVVDGSLTVNTLMGRISSPLRISRLVESHLFPTEQELNREYSAGLLGKVIVRSIRVELANVTPSTTQLNIYVAIENKLVVPLYVNNMVFRVRSGGVVLGEGEQTTPKLITSSEVDIIMFKAYLDNAKIPLFWYEHVKNRENSKVYIDVWLRVDISGRTIELFKENPLSITIKFETNVFKYK